jgi:hypothetical protein
MMDADHIYTLNHNIKQLQQMHHEDKQYVKTVSSGFLCKQEGMMNNRSSTQMFINNIDDIFVNCKKRRTKELPEKSD